MLKIKPSYIQRCKVRFSLGEARYRTKKKKKRKDCTQCPARMLPVPTAQHFNMELQLCLQTDHFSHKINVRVSSDEVLTSILTQLEQLSCNPATVPLLSTTHRLSALALSLKRGNKEGQAVELSVDGIRQDVACSN